jgi:hypothetical protein
MIPRRLFTLCAGIALLSASLPLPAQDDAYGHVRFTNESTKPVKLKVWNPRTERAPFEATVEAGKSADLTDKDGKPFLVGLGSSQIQVDGTEPKSVSTVATRHKDIYVVVWTKDGFKARTDAGGK